jgi:hypothetical protein
LEYTYSQCVCQQLPKVAVAEKLLKIVKSNPGASPDTLKRTIILESDNQAAHWHVLEHYEVNQSGQYHKIQPFMLHYILPSAFTMHHYRSPIRESKGIFFSFCRHFNHPSFFI